MSWLGCRRSISPPLTPPNGGEDSSSPPWGGTEGGLISEHDTRLLSQPNLGYLFVLLLVLATAWPIPGQWSVPASKEAWRQTVQYMTRFVQPEDGVLIHPQWVRFAYQYYEDLYQTPGQTYAPFEAIDENSDLDGRLNGLLNEHPIIWLIESHLDQPDPKRLVENWFAARYPLVTELYPPGITLKAFAPGYQRHNLPASATPDDVEFAEGLVLEGYDLHQDIFSEQDALFHPPSIWIPVTLYWSAKLGVGDVLPYVHLTDDIGQVWGASLERGNDSLHLYPPSRWGREQVIVQHLDVNLNPAIPPGFYNLVLGVGAEQVFLEAVLVME